MLLTELEMSARTENKRMTNHNTPQLSRMDLPIHCAAFPGLSRLNTRTLIEFLVHESESVVSIHKRLCAVYGSCAVDRSTAGWWAKQVKASGNAETELCDLPRASHPATANTPDMLKHADAIIPADWHITTQRLTLQLSRSTGSVCSIIEKCRSSMTMHALAQA
jgi:hypothetical protein